MNQITKTPTNFWTAPWELMRRFSDTSRPFGEWDFDATPALETFRRGKELVVRAELPGMRQEDVKVEWMDDGIIIQGERRQDYENKGDDFYRSERRYGQFRRFVALPGDAEGEKARAAFKDGVLEVVVPVSETARASRLIPIEPQASGKAVAAKTSPAPPR